MSDWLLKLTWACLACIAVGMIKPSWILPKEWQPTRRKVFGLYGLVALVAFIGFVATHEDPEKKAAQMARQQAVAQMIAKGESNAKLQNVERWPQIVENLTKASSEIVDVGMGVPGTGVVAMTYRFTRVWSAESVNLEIAGQMDRIMKAFLPNSQNVKQFWVQFDMPTTDNLGRTGQQPGLQLTFSVETLRQVNQDVIAGLAWTGAAEKIEVWPILKDGARKFCETRMTQYPAYCRAAMKGAF